LVIALIHVSTAMWGWNGLVAVKIISVKSYCDPGTSAYGVIGEDGPDSE
jgi:hypothetical protein